MIVARGDAFQSKLIFRGVLQASQGNLFCLFKVLLLLNVYAYIEYDTALPF
jgi:hypothetical protein